MKMLFQSRNYLLVCRHRIATLIMWSRHVSAMGPRTLARANRTVDGARSMSFSRSRGQRLSRLCHRSSSRTRRATTCFSSRMRAGSSLPLQPVFARTVPLHQTAKVTAPSPTQSSLQRGMSSDAHEAVHDETDTVGCMIFPWCNSTEQFCNGAEELRTGKCTRVFC